MGHLSPARLRDEWTTSRAALSDILGDDIRTASVPGGDFAPSVATAAADAGFTHLFTSEPIMTVRQIGSLTIAGRFTIQRWTSAPTAAALAAGRWLPCARQVALWNMKKLGKQIGGERYLQLRRVLLRHGHEVRWGDRDRDEGWALSQFEVNDGVTQFLHVHHSHDGSPRGTMEGSRNDGAAGRL